jgi:hypothetical protein
MTKTIPNSNFSWKRVIIKGIILFLIVNLLFGVFHPLPILGRISAYNSLLPGRLRFPFGEKPDLAYNFSLYSLEAMFASHELTLKEKPADEYRILLIGDSSVWGYLLKPEDTLAAYINSADLEVGSHQRVRAYNLGYPTMSLAKDLFILDSALKYKPDLIVWLVTLESFPREKQLDSPIVQNNPSRVKDFIHRYSLNLTQDDPRLITSGFLGSTLIGQRRAVADILRLQIYGILWAATGIDQYYPDSFEPPQANLPDDESFHEMLPSDFNPDDLSFDILAAGSRMADGVPILFINEPIFLSQGENSDIRYNFFYPRWAYDQYRQLFNSYCIENRWLCLDEWNLVSPSEFTNSAIHMSPQGTQQLASQIEDAILSIEKP